LDIELKTMNFSQFSDIFWDCDPAQLDWDFHTNNIAPDTLNGTIQTIRSSFITYAYPLLSPLSRRRREVATSHRWTTLPA